MNHAIYNKAVENHIKARYQRLAQIESEKEWGQNNDLSIEDRANYLLAKGIEYLNYKVKK